MSNLFWNVFTSFALMALTEAGKLFHIFTFLIQIPLQNSLFS